MRRPINHRLIVPGVGENRGRPLSAAGRGPLYSVVTSWAENRADNSGSRSCAERRPSSEIIYEEVSSAIIGYCRWILIDRLVSFNYPSPVDWNLSAPQSPDWSVGAITTPRELDGGSGRVWELFLHLFYPTLKKEFRIVHRISIIHFVLRYSNYQSAIAFDIRSRLFIHGIKENLKGSN